MDTSALVKLLIPEAGTLQTQTAVREAEVVGTSILSYAELRAAIASARRANRVTPEGYLSLMVEVNSLWHSLLRIVIDEDLVLRAGDLAERFGLRGYDAMHLASLIVFGEAGDTELACWDTDLQNAARSLGYQVVAS